MCIGWSLYMLLLLCLDGVLLGNELGNTHHSNVTDEQYEKRLLLKFRSDFPSSHFPKKKNKRWFARPNESREKPWLCCNIVKGVAASRLLLVIAEFFVRDSHTKKKCNVCEIWIIFFLSSSKQTWIFY